MNKRLLLFIDYKTGGNHKEFADLLGWSPQYLHKMLKGDSMGIQPVTSLLQKFPELNARWLILGEGAMIDVESNTVRRIINLFNYEKYIPVMSHDEISRLESGMAEFDYNTISRWSDMLKRRQEEIDSRFRAAYRKQEKTGKNS